MRSIRRMGVAVVAAAAGLAVALPAGAAVAAPPAPTAATATTAGDEVIGGGDGASVAKPPLTAAEKARGQAKEDAARAWYAAAHGTGTVAAYDRARRDYAAASGERLPAFARSTASATAAKPAYALKLWHTPQQTNYWCGPATAAMLIRQLHRAGKIPTENSRDDNEYKRTQTNLARPRYLDAENDGTYRTHMMRGLNRWAKPATKYDVDSEPSVSRFRWLLEHNVRNTKMAMAVATIEHAGGYHYNGHPENSTVDHWVAAYGYNDEKGSTRIADAATGISSWTRVEKYADLNTSKFVSRHVSSKAVVW